MPLSEHEQRLLDQMEKALYAEDPKFATSLRSTPAVRAARGRASLGFLAVLGGIALLIAGVSTAVIALGVAGFLLMLGGAFIAYSAFSRRAAAETGDAPAAPGPATPAKGPGFMDRMEDRWRRRAEDGDQ
jgi:Flp pilus assembly protein TadB